MKCARLGHGSQVGWYMHPVHFGGRLSRLALMAHHGLTSHQKTGVIVAGYIIRNWEQNDRTGGIVRRRSVEEGQRQVTQRVREAQ